MAELENEYLEKRAEAEISLAQAAAHPAAVRAHYRLAGLYLDRLYCPEEGNVTHRATVPSGDRAAIRVQTLKACFDR